MHFVVSSMHMNNVGADSSKDKNSSKHAKEAYKDLYGCCDKPLIETGYFAKACQNCGHPKFRTGCWTDVRNGFVDMIQDFELEGRCDVFPSGDMNPRTISLPKDLYDAAHRAGRDPDAYLAELVKYAKDPSQPGQKVKIIGSQSKGTTLRFLREGWEVRLETNETVIVRAENLEHVNGAMLRSKFHINPKFDDFLPSTRLFILR